MQDDYYLPGGSEQLFMNRTQMETLKQHGFISARKPTNFPDYDPKAVNTDGSTGNILPKGDIGFENVLVDQAVLRANRKP